MKNFIGVNIIGHISGNLGLGVAARNIIGCLISRGIQVRILNIDPGLKRNDFDTSYNTLFCSNIEELIFPINMFILSPSFFNREFIKIFSEKINTGYAYWELPNLTENIKENFKNMDAIIAPSTFIYETYGREIDNILLIKGKTPYFFDFDKVNKNKKGSDTFKIFSAFEPNSDIERKNPYLIIRCFKLAFINTPNVELTIKINNAFINGTTEIHPEVQDLISHCEDDARIKIDTRTFNQMELMEYFQNFNIAISLHRAEGFGLMPLEMMAIGIPVISTNWSGNTDYMNSDNSLLVRHCMIEANGNIGIYKSINYKNGTQWADPNLEDAVYFLKYAFSNDLEKISTKAKKSALSYIEEANQVKFIDELITIQDTGIITKTRSKS